MQPQDVIVFSALSRLGREDVWATILAACGVDPAARPAPDAPDAAAGAAGAAGVVDGDAGAEGGAADGGDEDP